MNIMMGSLLLIWACAPALSTGTLPAEFEDKSGMPNVTPRLYRSNVSRRNAEWNGPPEIEEIWRMPYQTPRLYRSNYSRWDGQWNGPLVKTGETSYSILPDHWVLAYEQGWSQIARCDSSTKFPAVRFVKNGDYSLILMYNLGRYLAGIQCGIPKAGLPDNYPPRNQIGRIYQDDGDRYVISVYFNEPGRTCNGDHVEPLYSYHEPSAYIQTGPDPSNSTNFIRVPFRKKYLEPSWQHKKRCQHNSVYYYSYNLRRNMNCSDVFPVFLMYNASKLYALGFALGVHQTSAHFEHPTTFKISNFMKPNATCWDATYPHQSVMHIYLTDQRLCIHP